MIVRDLTDDEVLIAEVQADRRIEFTSRRRHFGKGQQAIENILQFIQVTVGLGQRPRVRGIVPNLLKILPYRRGETGMGQLRRLLTVRGRVAGTRFRLMTKFAIRLSRRSTGVDQGAGGLEVGEGRGVEAPFGQDGVIMLTGEGRRRLNFRRGAAEPRGRRRL